MVELVLPPCPPPTTASAAVDMNTALSQLSAVILTAMADEAMVQLRLTGLSDAEKRQWARDFWLAAPMRDARMRLFGLRESSSG
jgi:hypothetical protein